GQIRTSLELILLPQTAAILTGYFYIPNADRLAAIGFRSFNRHLETRWFSFQKQGINSIEWGPFT
ncbi:MAG: hypothetical protein ACU83O_11770, partial [Gammaproteobacteria bacterium]